MNFFSVMNNIYSFFHDNMAVAVILGFILLYILYRWPRLFMLMLITAVLATGVFYVISDISSTAAHKKKRLTKEYSVE